MISIQPVVVALYNQSGVKRNKEGTVVCCYECINVYVVVKCIHTYLPVPTYRLLDDYEIPTNQNYPLCTELWRDS